MDKKIINLRKKELENSDNKKYKEKREKYGTKYGKEFLLDNFQLGIENLKKSNKSFFGVFNAYVEKKLLEKSGNGIITHKKRVEIQKLFGKFGAFYKKYKDEIEKIIQINLKKEQEIKNQSKEKIFNILNEFDQKIETNKNFEYMINPREEDFMSMDDEGNILPPI